MPSQGKTTSTSTSKTKNEQAQQMEQHQLLASHCFGIVQLLEQYQQIDRYQM